MKPEPQEKTQDAQPGLLHPVVRLIVCAAVRNRQETIIVCGARHFDGIMRAQIAAMNTAEKIWEQGFIDQRGNFLTRGEAWKIANAAGQIRRRCGGDVKLSDSASTTNDSKQIL